jgi:Ca2+-dependent lipid-binding protein
MMEWAISFTPNDVQDMTYAAAAKKVNPKIVLNIRVGVGPAVVGKDIIVEDLSVTGVMRIKLKLMNNFPHGESPARRAQCCH